MAVKSHKLGPGTLTFNPDSTPGGGVQFAAALTSIAVEPSSDEGDPIPVLSGDEVDGDGTEGHTLTGNLLQSYDEDSLLLWAYENRGKRVPYLFIPDDGRELAVSGVAKIKPLKIGGDVKTRNQSEVSWACVGMYKLVKASAPETDIVWRSSLTPEPEPPAEQTPGWE